jgi:hypothetical protein
LHALLRQELATFGLPTNVLLGDPSIAVLNASGTTIASNNNWNQGAAGSVSQAATLAAAFPAVGAFALSPGGDAALVSALAPGSSPFALLPKPRPPAPARYQTGATNTINETGMVLVEIYEVP